MSVTVLIPTPLRKLSQDQPTVQCTAGNITEVIDALDQTYPGIKSRLCAENGDLRRFVNFYVNNEDIRFLQGRETLLKDGDEVSIVPAVAGG